ncbi:MAG: hypothetical protein OXG39_06715 [Chloroflexi bacterium]|nr:hypothetical protein [Chloroflexota bacterium]
MEKAKKRTASRAIGCRRLFLAACIALGLICSLPFVLTSPELQWHIDHNIRPPIITPAPASKESDLIAFICTRNHGSHPGAIYIIHPDGRQVRQIHARSYARYADLSWSPDGMWVAVVISYVYGFLPNEKYEIYRIRFDGLDSRRLTYNHFREFGPRWSKDGKSIWFFSSETMHKTSVDGAEISQSYDSYIGASLLIRRPVDWSSDEQRIIAIGTYDAILSGSDPDGSDWRELTRAGMRPDAVAWSGDDERIMYFSNDVSFEFSKLVVFDVKKQVEHFSLKMNSIHDARWLPDGNWIAIKGRALDEDEGAHIYLLDIHTGVMNYITAMTTGDLGKISWSPDSEWIAFSTYPWSGGDSRIFKIKRDGTAFHQLTRIDCRIREISWSPK